MVQQVKEPRGSKAGGTSVMMGHGVPTAMTTIANTSKLN